ncbi:MAG: hypothetical protein H6555_12155 [Lewinellaceae bacterium]|nr:hypothetical protein [Lewinellaceae bacterium]
MDRPYQPISCDYYDFLEAWALKRKQIQIHYLDEQGGTHMLEGVIRTLETRNKEEFMILDSGVEIRLDRIQAIDGKVPPAHC